MSALHFRLKSLSKAEMQVRFPGESYTGMPDECRSRVRTYHSKSPVLGLKKYKIKSVIRANRTRRASKSGLHSQSQSLFRRKNPAETASKSKILIRDRSGSHSMSLITWVDTSIEEDEQSACMGAAFKTDCTEGCYGDELEASYTNRCVYK